MEVYVYTRMPQIGELVCHHGNLTKGEPHAHFTNFDKPNHWMTRLSNKEGEVRGHSVWFTKPSREKAIKALNAKDKERTEALMARAERTLARVSL